MALATTGIYHYEEQKFFVLELGNNKIVNPVTPLRSMLRQRDIINEQHQPHIGKVQYRVMSLKDAQEAKKEIFPMALNTIAEATAKVQKPSTLPDGFVDPFAS